jgi:Flp pilus assembly protein TadG
MATSGVRRRLRSRLGERGAAMAEMAIILPFMAMLVMGTIEFGEGWQANLRAQSATRSAGRTGSSLSTNRQADYFMLQTLKAGLTKFTTAEVRRIVIYRVTTANGLPTSGCMAGVADPGDCNVYTGLQMNTLTSANFSGTTCAVGSPDYAWCPTTRNNTQANADQLGVWVEVFYTYKTRYFPGSGITMRHYVVMRIEPKVGT